MNYALVFLFSGQGSHYYQMGRELYDKESVFRNWMQKMDQYILKESGKSVLTEIYADDKKTSDQFDKLELTHPAIFMVQFAIAKTLAQYGIEPEVVLGTSLGEYVAAAYTGIIDHQEALLKIIEQATLISQQCTRGGMLSILDNPQNYYSDSILHENSELVSINFDGHYTVSGSDTGIKKIVTHLKTKEILHQELMLTEGFHSSTIDPISDDFIKTMSQLDYKNPIHSYISCVTGKPLDSFNAEYFWRVAREPIKFREAVRHLVQTQNEYLCLDLGPSGTLATFMKYMVKNSLIKAEPIITPFGRDMKNLESLLNRLQTKEVFQ